MDVCVDGKVVVRVSDTTVERQLVVARTALGLRLTEEGLALPVVAAEANPAGVGIRAVGARSLPGHIEKLRERQERWVRLSSVTSYAPEQDTPDGRVARRYGKG